MVDSFLFDRILSLWHGRNARSSFTLLQMSLSSVAGVTPVFHYPCSQRIYLKWVAGVALCAIPTLDTPRGEAHLYLFLPPTIQR